MIEADNQKRINASIKSRKMSKERGIDGMIRTSTTFPSDQKFFYNDTKPTFDTHDNNNGSGSPVSSMTNTSHVSR